MKAPVMPDSNNINLLKLCSELELQNQKLRKENENKNELLASVAHELRNPLGAVINFSYLLKQSNSVSQDGIEYVDYIKSSGEELLAFTQDLLDVSQLNSGKFSVDISKKIDLKQVIERAILFNHGLALKRKINITKQIADDLPTAYLDARRMKQILVNLISNSIKYSPENTAINVFAKMANDQIEIAVADKGFGMTPKELELALKRYETVENDNSGKVDAFGIGLPLVKELVEAQNGKIEINSKKNEGTEIRLKFLY